MTLLLSSIAHLLVDGVCACIVFGAKARGEDIVLIALIYNTLAFATQCILGEILDRRGHAKDLGRAAMLIVALCGIIPFGIMPRICIVGLANSLFHVACGSMTIMKYKGSAKELGIFVAPGAIGVTLGSLFPSFGTAFAIALLAIGALTGHIGKDDFDYNALPEAESSKMPVLEVCLLTAAVAVRAIGGCAVSFPWKQGAAAALLMTFFVFAGKFLGGFVLNKLGTVKTALVSIIPATVCIVLLNVYAVPSLIGQFLINLTMPVTLFLLVKAMPDSPGLAFGLAASALWPGTLVGELFTLTGPLLWICIIISFVFGLAAVLFCERRLK